MFYSKMYIYKCYNEKNPHVLIEKHTLLFDVFIIFEMSTSTEDNKIKEITPFRISNASIAAEVCNHKSSSSSQLITASKWGVLNEKRCKRKDNRLFADETLYNEKNGRERTYFRGKIHLFSDLTVFPYFVWLYYDASKNDKYVLFIGLLCLSVIYTAHIISAIFHVFPTTVTREIFLQKLDHTFASFYIAAAYYPMCLLLFPDYIGWTMISITTCINIFNWNNIWHCRPSMLGLALIVLVEIPFLYFLAIYMNRFELIMNATTILSGAIAAIVQVKEYCPSFLNIKGVFNFFDFYHVCSVGCFVSVLLMNYSIVKRTAGSCVNC